MWCVWSDIYLVFSGCWWHSLRLRPNALNSKLHERTFLHQSNLTSSSPVAGGWCAERLGKSKELSDITCFRSPPMSESFMSSCTDSASSESSFPTLLPPIDGRSRDLTEAESSLACLKAATLSTRVFSDAPSAVQNLDDWKSAKSSVSLLREEKEPPPHSFASS